jgi:hypothetical protein
MALFPVPAHQTGSADLPHKALRQNFEPGAGDWRSSGVVAYLVGRDGGLVSAPRRSWTSAPAASPTSSRRVGGLRIGRAGTAEDRGLLGCGQQFVVHWHNSRQGPARRHGSQHTRGVGDLHTLSRGAISCSAVRDFAVAHVWSAERHWQLISINLLR